MKDNLRFKGLAVLILALTAMMFLVGAPTGRLRARHLPVRGVCR